jgi:hypothetical protein
LSAVRSGRSKAQITAAAAIATAAIIMKKSAFAMAYIVENDLLSYRTRDALDARAADSV